ncbi:MAG: hypothetical protein ACRCVN_06820 [Spirochaetia bacterium]
MLRIALAFTIGLLTILSRFYPLIIGLIPLIGIILAIMSMIKANRVEIFFATLAMAVCLVGIVLVIFVPGGLPATK